MTKMVDVIGTQRAGQRKISDVLTRSEQETLHVSNQRLQVNLDVPLTIAKLSQLIDQFQQFA